MALSCRQRRPRESALPEFPEESVRLNPDFAEAWFNEGNALRSTGRIPEAVSAYQEALTVKPDYPEAAMNLGNLHLQMGQLDLAVRYFQAALRVRPGLADAQTIASGSPSCAPRNFADAVGEFNEAIRLNPSYFQLLTPISPPRCANSATAKRPTSSWRKPLELQARCREPVDK